MVTKQRQTIWQRIKSRMKGLAALLMSVALVVGMMPAVEARADDEPDNYYLIGFVSGYDAILCKGKETMTGIPSNQKVFGPWNGDNTGTYYVNLSNNSLNVPEGSPLSKVGMLGSTPPSEAVDLEVSANTTFYFGTTSGYKFYIEVKLDGVSQGTTTGEGNSNKKSFNIDAGKYTVQHTSTDETNGRKWIVDIKTLISSISLSSDNLEFVVGDDAKTLTVSPEGAEVKWTTSDKNVASVDSYGKVIPVAPGKATITATLKDDATVSASCEVTVSSKSDDNQDHNHNFVYKEAKEATYTEAGYKAHYECTECHMWAEDANGNHVYTEEEMKELIIPPKTRPNENSSSSSSDSDSDSDSNNDSETSGGGSSGKSGSISQKTIDVNGNTVQTQPDSGAPVSDRGGNWGNHEHIWTYTKSDGSLAKGEWLNLEYDGHTYWYYFDDSTIMQTNWFDYNGSRYFLVPEMDGWRGRMATGWHMVDNKWYYFEPTIGANQGILYRGMTTPDGHIVGADGAWDGNGTTPVGAIHTGTTVTMN